MAIKDKPANDRDAEFHLGESDVPESRSIRDRPASALQVDDTAPKAANEARGFDPYNTSGSFDRKKHWARVGKR